MLLIGGELRSWLRCTFWMEEPEVPEFLDSECCSLAIFVVQCISYCMLYKTTVILPSENVCLKCVNVWSRYDLPSCKLIYSTSQVKTHFNFCFF